VKKIGGNMHLKSSGWVCIYRWHVLECIEENNRRRMTSCQDIQGQNRSTEITKKEKNIFELKMKKFVTAAFLGDW
jgi:hypothetical protein